MKSPRTKRSKRRAISPRPKSPPPNPTTPAQSNPSTTRHRRIRCRLHRPHRCRHRRSPSWNRHRAPSRSAPKPRVRSLPTSYPRRAPNDRGLRDRGDAVVVSSELNSARGQCIRSGNNSTAARCCRNLAPGPGVVPRSSCQLVTFCKTPGFSKSLRFSHGMVSSTTPELWWGDRALVEIHPHP